MEAACTAAEVGCNVFVLEKKDHLGGLSTFISDLPSKTRMKDFPKYLEARAARLKNLYIFLNTDATVEKIAVQTGYRCKCNWFCAACSTYQGS